MTNLFSLEGKNAWITGASYGIGFNIAKAFAAADIKTIIFNDINEELVQRGLDSYKEAGILDIYGAVEDPVVEDSGGPPELLGVHCRHEFRRRFPVGRHQILERICSATP